MLTRSRGTIAATAITAAVFALAVARAIAESEHDPCPPDCPKCGRFAPSYFGPVVLRWMNDHDCKGDS